jgi:hypothetical protein
MPLSNSYGYCAIADVQNTINIKCAILNNTRYEATLVQWYSGYGRLTWYLAHAKVMSMPSNTEGCTVVGNGLDLSFSCINIGNITYPSLFMTAKRWHDGSLYWEIE